MTLNTVKPRSAIRRLSPSMVCGTDLLLGFSDNPVRRLRAVWHQASFRREARLCPAARAGRCLILVHECVARQRRTLHPPSGGPASVRSHHGGRRARTGPGSPADATKLVNRHDRGGAPTRVPAPTRPKGPDPATRSRPDHRRYAHTAQHRQSPGGLPQHRQDPLIMPIRVPPAGEDSPFCHHARSAVHELPKRVRVSRSAAPV